MDRYSSSRYTPTSNAYRSKSPFGRPSSSMSNSSTNLRVDSDAFDALNQSLGRHDASFVRDLNTTGNSSFNDTIPGRYNPVKKPGSYGKYDSNNNSFNTSGSGNNSNKWKSSDYKNRSFDLNNNSSFQAGCADSDSDVELSKPRQYTTSYTTTYSSPLYDPVTGNRSNAYTTESKGFQFFATRNPLPDGSVDDDEHSIEIDDVYNDADVEFSDDNSNSDNLPQYTSAISGAIDSTSETVTSVSDSEEYCNTGSADSDIEQPSQIPIVVISDASLSDVELPLHHDNIVESEVLNELSNNVACEARAWSHNSEDEEFDSVSQCTDDSLNKYLNCETFLKEHSGNKSMQTLAKTGNSLVQDDDLFVSYQHFPQSPH